MFRDERGKPFLKEAAIEIRVVGDDEHYPAYQIVDGSMINAVTRDHLIGNAGFSHEPGGKSVPGDEQPSLQARRRSNFRYWPR